VGAHGARRCKVTQHIGGIQPAINGQYLTGELVAGNVPDRRNQGMHGLRLVRRLCREVSLVQFFPLCFFAFVFVYAREISKGMGLRIELATGE
jgi:hypothetical protein